MIEPSDHTSGLLERLRRIDREAGWGTTPSLNLARSWPGLRSCLGTIYPAAEFALSPGHINEPELPNVIDFHQVQPNSAELRRSLLNFCFFEFHVLTSNGVVFLENELLG